MGFLEQMGIRNRHTIRGFKCSKCGSDRKVYVTNILLNDEKITIDAMCHKCKASQDGDRVFAFLCNNGYYFSTLAVFLLPWWAQKRDGTYGKDGYYESEVFILSTLPKSFDDIKKHLQEPVTIKQPCKENPNARGEHDPVKCGTRGEFKRMVGRFVGRGGGSFNFTFKIKKGYIPNVTIESNEQCDIDTMAMFLS